MDYAFIYRHMAHLMTGDIPPDPPNKATADRMIRLWVSLKDAVRATVPTMETAIDKLRNLNTHPEAEGLPAPLPDVGVEAHLHTPAHQLPGVDPFKLVEKMKEDSATTDKQSEK